MLDSLVAQTLRPNQVVLVNDQSTDQTQDIIEAYVRQYPFITSLTTDSVAEHEPGAKVVAAFNKGMELLSDFDLIGKFDGDIILPSDYFETLVDAFQTDPKIGLAGGHLYIQKNKEWIYEGISAKTKLRGPIKLYRKECFKQIGGLKESIGWDTVDQYLAKYYGWKVYIDASLKVKHLKPTGANYAQSAKFKQGMAFRRMRYGFFLSAIAALKLGYQKNSFILFINSILGYFKNGTSYMVSEEEGKFIRQLRWKNIKKKLF